MANFAATDTVTIHDTVEDAVAGLETALEATDNGKTVQTCQVVPVFENKKYAAVLVVTDAVA